MALTADQLASLRVSLASAATTAQGAKGRTRTEALQLRAAIALDLQEAGESIEALRALTGVKNASSVHDMLRAARVRRLELHTRIAANLNRDQLALAAEDASKAADLADQEAAARYAEQDAAADARRVQQLLESAVDPEGLKNAPSMEARDRNQAKRSASKSDQRCPLCSSPLKENEEQTTGAWVHLTTDGFLLRADTTQREEDLITSTGKSLGWFVVGSGCARRVPAGYKVPVTKKTWS